MILTAVWACLSQSSILREPTFQVIIWPRAPTTLANPLHISFSLLIMLTMPSLWKYSYLLLFTKWQTVFNFEKLRLRWEESKFRLFYFTHYKRKRTKQLKSKDMFVADVNSKMYTEPSSVTLYFHYWSIFTSKPVTRKWRYSS